MDIKQTMGERNVLGRWQTILYAIIGIVIIVGGLWWVIASYRSGQSPTVGPGSNSNFPTVEPAPEGQLPAEWPSTVPLLGQLSQGAIVQSQNQVSQSAPNQKESLVVFKSSFTPEHAYLAYQQWAKNNKWVFDNGAYTAMDQTGFLSLVQGTESLMVTINPSSATSSQGSSVTLYLVR